MRARFSVPMELFENPSRGSKPRGDADSARVFGGRGRIPAGSRGGSAAPGLQVRRGWTPVPTAGAGKGRTGGGDAIEPSVPAPAAGGRIIGRGRTFSAAFGVVGFSE